MKGSKIEWTDHTANFWMGCLKVSPGCTYCYAEALSKRHGRNIWGPAETTNRQRTKGAWNDVVTWNRKACENGVRERVFVLSLGDFFENHPQIGAWRAEALELMLELDNLDFLILTKRPENVAQMVEEVIGDRRGLSGYPNLWLGVSVEDQRRADERLDAFRDIEVWTKFVSYEPALGPVDWSRWKFIDWLIIGGESGLNARPFDLDWARGAIAWCRESGVTPFVKQLGSNPRVGLMQAGEQGEGQELLYAVSDYKGGNMAEWPDDLKIREFPEDWGVFNERLSE